MLEIRRDGPYCRLTANAQNLYLTPIVASDGEIKWWKKSDSKIRGTINITSNSIIRETHIGELDYKGMIKGGENFPAQEVLFVCMIHLISADGVKKPFYFDHNGEIPKALYEERECKEDTRIRWHKQIDNNCLFGGKMETLADLVRSTRIRKFRKVLKQRQPCAHTPEPATTQAPPAHAGACQEQRQGTPRRERQGLRPAPATTKSRTRWEPERQQWAGTMPAGQGPATKPPAKQR